MRELTEPQVAGSPAPATPVQEDAVRGARWYQDAVIYQVHLRAFRDANGDGIGDLRGLIERLDYLQDLGVTALWLLPFYPSPLRDDGYDIADYTAVHPDYGTLQDVEELIREAHRRGLKVITELVCNHTSDQHAWFQRARRSPAGSSERDFYVWSSSNVGYADARIIFKDFETSNWAWDPVAQAYYWHRFYGHQPDLNFDNPLVKQAIKDVLDFWFAMGIDGLRLDAVPYLFEREGTSCENLPETHAFLKELRAHVDRGFTDRMLLAEANQWPEDAAAYFGQGDECHMAFHFPLMPRLFLALHGEDRFPIVDTLAQTPAIPDGCQWTVFLRNHDELTLEMVTEEERDLMYRAYAKDDRARINLGIRRRLAPLLNNNRRRIELLHALLFSLPGTPVMYYGDEIGMGDNIWLGDRNGVRTPMQWNPGLNAGFSEASRQRLFLPVVVEPEYHFESVNVLTQQQNPQSLLWWTKRLIALRQRTAAFGRGSMTIVNCENPHVLCYVRRYQDERVLVVANLSRFAQPVTLDLTEHRGLVPVEMLGRVEFPTVGDAPYLLTLGPHSFFWFSLEPARAPTPPAQDLRASDDGLPPAPKAQTGRYLRDELLPSLAPRAGWQQELRASTREVQRALVRFVRTQPWFRGRPDEVRSVRTVDVIPLTNEPRRVSGRAGEEPSAATELPRSRTDGLDAALVLVEVGRIDREPEVFALTIAHATGPLAERLLVESRGSVLARLAGGKGVLHDTASEPPVTEALVGAIVGGHELRGVTGALIGKAERQGVAPTGRPTARGGVVLLGHEAVLRIARRVEPGPSPGVEMLRALAARGYTAAPRLLGSLEHVATAGARSTVATLEAYVQGDGNAFTHAVEAAGLFFERVIARDEPPPSARHPVALVGDLDTARSPVELPEQVLGFVRGLGRQLALLHCVLAAPTDDPAFAPQPFTPFYQRSLYQSLRNLAGVALRRARRALPLADARTKAQLERFLRAERLILDAARPLFERRIAASCIRVHGALDLRHVVRTGATVAFVDFEGGATRTLAERRFKRNGLRDVAALVRSFQEATLTALTARSVRPVDVDQLLPWARAWWLWTAGALLEGYLVAAPPGHVPARPEDVRLLLDVHLQALALHDLSQRLDEGSDQTWVVADAILTTLEAS